MLVLYLGYRIKALFCSYGYCYIHMNVVLLETLILFCSHEYGYIHVNVVLLSVEQDNYN
jgi:hypothetical protein